MSATKKCLYCKMRFRPTPRSVAIADRGSALPSQIGAVVGLIITGWLIWRAWEWWSAYQAAASRL
jgi:hypothetical protein